MLRVVLPLLGSLLKLLGVKDDDDDDVITRLLLCVGVGCGIGGCCDCDGRCEAGVELRLLLLPPPLPL